MKTETEKLALTIPCSSCGAAAGSPCVSGTGKVRGPHTPRTDHVAQVRRTEARMERMALEAEEARLEAELEVAHQAAAPVRALPARGQLSLFGSLS